MTTIIPKKIHYCWFGGAPLSKQAIECIESWKKYMPDYEIVRWDESNFDVNICSYTKQAYEHKKWAFVSDVARFWIIYNFGGIYFDTDVELTKPLDKILNQGSFMGAENHLSEDNISKENLVINPGLGIAAYKNHHLYKEILDNYFSRNFLDKEGNYNGITVVHIVTEILKHHGLKDSNDIQKIDDITLYPKDYFCPLDYKTGKLDITQNTVSIHWYSASWQTPYMRLKGKIKKLIKSIFVSN